MGILAVCDIISPLKRFIEVRIRKIRKKNLAWRKINQEWQQNWNHETKERETVGAASRRRKTAKEEQVRLNRMRNGNFVVILTTQF